MMLEDFVSIKGMFLALSIFSMFMPFFIHLFLVRVCGLFKEKFTRQKGAIVSILLGFMILCVLFLSWVSYANMDMLKILYPAFYLCGVYLGFSYVYFHVFNMSETARRIRILAECKKIGSLTKDQLSANYRCNDMVLVRLKRLVSLGSLRLGNDRYILGNKALLYVAKAVFSIRKIFFSSCL